MQSLHGCRTDVVQDKFALNNRRDCKKKWASAQDNRYLLCKRAFYSQRIISIKV